MFFSVFVQCFERRAFHARLFGMDDSRRERLERLGRGGFDLLVVGGGATGLGVALDAASRGLRVALVERLDLAEGTSGRSTKLIHGGVRYLEKAVKRLDRAQYSLVREGLRERATLLRIAPHLVHPLDFITPIQGFLRVPYIMAGLCLYDMLAGEGRLAHCRYLTPDRALEVFPCLNSTGLSGAVLFQDGQFNDGRMCVALAQSAEALGGVVMNHARVEGLEFSGGRVVGAHVVDELSGETLTVTARVVVNACGPFADSLRRMEESTAPDWLTTSTGAHVSLPSRFSPPGVGLLIPSTEDGRVLFVIPWEGGVIAGTTDDPAGTDAHPTVSEGEIGYILRHLALYLDPAPTREDVLSAWSGLRPLLKASGSSTQELVREHRIEVGPRGLVTVAGGKWTSYRRMAAQTVAAAVKAGGLKPARPSATSSLVLAGSEGFDRTGVLAKLAALGLDDVTAGLLVRAYGSTAPLVGNLATGGYGARLHPAHPFIEAQVIHAVRDEYARRPVDVLARRTPLALLDLAAARAALPRVARLMAAELGWDGATHEAMVAEAETLLDRAL